MRNQTTAPRANKPRKPYVTAYKGDDVCVYVRVGFTGMWDGTNRVIGNRSRTLMVPEARVSEVHEIVSRVLAGLIEPSSNEKAGAP